MRFTFDFPGSELRDVVVDGTLTSLRLAAAAVRDDAGRRGWLSSVRIDVSGATLHGDTAHAFGKIAEASLRRDGAGIAPLAVPGVLAGDLELALRLANGTRFVVRGHALTSTVADGARFTDDLSC